MERIRTRTELVLFARDHCGSYACKRAFLTGNVTVLGGFQVIPPGTDPGWVLCVKSRHGRTWLLAITTDDIKHCYHIRQIQKIPWSQWGGDFHAPPGQSIYSGDMPMQASAAAGEATRRERLETLARTRSSINLGDI